MPVPLKKIKETQWIVAKEDCDGNVKVVDVWLPEQKTFQDGETIPEKINSLLGKYNGIRRENAIGYRMQNGVSIETIENYCQIPTFKRIWKQLEGTIKPLWEEGETVILFESKGQSGRATLTPFNCGKIVGYTQSSGCEIVDGKPTEPIRCVREMLNSKTQSRGISAEDKFISLKAIEEFENKRKGARKVVKTMRDLNMRGGYLHYDGQVYEF
jgi:hypothetical protein